MHPSIIALFLILLNTILTAPHTVAIISTRPSSPNQVSTLYPDNIAGNANYTIAIMPFPDELESIAPEKWGFKE
jgi:hypothetical protein